IFTAASLSCAKGFRWTATNTGWTDMDGAKGPWTTLTNTISLIPSGTAADQGKIAVDIDLGCKTLTQTYDAIYTDPGLPYPAFPAAKIKVLCSDASATISVIPVPGAGSYSWYTVPMSEGF